MYTLHREQTVNKPLKEVFEFFAKPENLSKITPPSMGFTILTPQPIEMKVGAIIDYTVKVFGLPVHWTTLISDYTPPHKFVDVQIRGPYKFWHHTHTFKETSEGTLIIDDVRYLVPLGPLGDIANALSVKHQLNSIFDYRSKVIEKEFKD